MKQSNSVANLKHSSDSKLIKQPSETQKPSNGKSTKRSLNILIEKDGKSSSLIKNWREFRIDGKQITSRSYHSASVYGDCLYVYGGYELNTGVLSDFYYLNLKAEKFNWEEVRLKKDLHISPGTLHRHQSQVYKDYLYIFGGKKTTLLGSKELWRFSFKEFRWEKMENKSLDLQTIDSHSSVLIDNLNGEACILYFGGYFSEKANFSRNLIGYFPEKNSWKLIYEKDKTLGKKQNVPSKRANSAVCVIGTNLFIFGGNNNSTRFNDMWKFSLEEATWQRIEAKGEAPITRSGHSMVAYYNHLIIFGGIHDVAHEVNDVHSLSLNESKWIKHEVDTSRSSYEVLSPGRAGQNKRADDEYIDQNNTSLSSVRNSAVGIKNNASVALDISSLASRGGISSDINRIKALISPKYISGFVPRTFDKHKKTSENFNVEKTQEVISPKKEQIRKQNFMKKMMMLSEFEVSDKERGQFEEKSPTTEAMKNSIKDLHLEKNKIFPNNRKININQEYLDTAAVKKCLGEDNLIEDKKPCARDGFSSNLFENKLIIFGGDRHLMPFHDVYFLDLEGLFKD